ncbi:hypothetical protein H5410_003868 [Solanum commersonii]|uniref:Retrotransposon gag domain-containing protein n=1 Tax=Solanum commersonii TaxID=4109 RepID=A0A9J6B6V7_SOLCO|nr:hypothetical protein H5410_003868 [Solanum commersonii]
MAKDDNISTASGSLGTDLIATTQTSFTNIPLPRNCCGLGHHIDGSAVIPDQVLTGDQPNPAYHVWLKQDQLLLGWIVASVSEGILPQLAGAETAHKAWSKLVAAYASGSKPQIRELKIQLHTLQRDNASIETYVQHAKEFIVADLGPTYRPFTRSLESRQEDISFDALYELLLNEERQLKRDEALNSPTTQFTHTSVATNRGRGRGRGNRGRDRSSNHAKKLGTNMSAFQIGCNGEHEVPLSIHGQTKRDLLPLTGVLGLLIQEDTFQEGARRGCSGREATGLDC